MTTPTVQSQQYYHLDITIGVSGSSDDDDDDDEEKSRKNSIGGYPSFACLLTLSTEKQAPLRETGVSGYHLRLASAGSQLALAKPHVSLHDLPVHENLIKTLTMYLYVELCMDCMGALCVNRCS